MYNISFDTKTVIYVVNRSQVNEAHKTVERCKLVPPILMTIGCGLGLQDGLRGKGVIQEYIVD